MTLGLCNLNSFRNAIGIYGGVDLCSQSYKGGRLGGTIWGAATLWAAGLNGGSNSMFWAGNGARPLAAAAGMTLDQTLIGSMLDAMGPAFRICLAARLSDLCSKRIGGRRCGNSLRVPHIYMEHRIRDSCLARGFGLITWNYDRNDKRQVFGEVSRSPGGR